MKDRASQVGKRRTQVFGRLRDRLVARRKARQRDLAANIVECRAAGGLGRDCRVEAGAGRRSARGERADTLQFLFGERQFRFGLPS